MGAALKKHKSSRGNTETRTNRNEIIEETIPTATVINDEDIANTKDIKIANATIISNNAIIKNNKSVKIYFPNIHLTIIQVKVHLTIIQIEIHSINIHLIIIIRIEKSIFKKRLNFIYN